jgi:hypothetical protein
MDEDGDDDAASAPPACLGDSRDFYDSPQDAADGIHTPHPAQSGGGIIFTTHIGKPAGRQHTVAMKRKHKKRS